jgi:hypothetical protein
MKKTFFLLVIPFIIYSCGVDPTEDIKVGGIYVYKEDTAYWVVKVLAMDDTAVHVRIYSNQLKAKPGDISSDTLKSYLGHAPVPKEDFMSQIPQLIKVEEVKETDLDNYKLYLMMRKWKDS